MSDLICVTNRHLCTGDFLQRIEEIAAAKPKAIILREKDLTAAEYTQLAQQILPLCSRYGTQLILHSFPDVAHSLSCNALHLPLSALQALHPSFPILGASCHSVEDALCAERLGCSYITAGHIFDTDCKKGLPGRGLDFLREVCAAVSIPVYAIGGISPENADSVRKAGAAGVCIMGSAMKAENVQDYLTLFGGKQ